MANTQNTETNAPRVLSQNIDEFTWAILPLRTLNKLAKELGVPESSDKREVCQSLSRYTFRSETAIQLINEQPVKDFQELLPWTSERFATLVAKLGYQASIDAVEVILSYKTQEIEKVRKLLDYNEEVLSK